MKKNVWENIAKAFCIPLEREFTVEYSSKAGKYKVAGTYKFTKNGLECTDFDKIPYSDILPRILSGELSIIPKPWKPKVGDKYYYVAESISGGLYVETLKWNNDITDYCAYRCGNCFASEEEAEAQMYELRYTLSKYYTEKENK